MTNVTSKRQSYGLTLPESSDSVVSNILTSLATLDETAQLQWIQETSRQVDNERAYQRKQNGVNDDSGNVYDRYDGIMEPDEGDVQLPITGVGYRERGRDGSYGIATAPAPSPAVAMGRSTKQGFFRRFMGIGPKVPIDSDLVTTQQPRKLIKNSSSVQVREIKDLGRDPPLMLSQPNIPEESGPNILKKKSSNFFRRRPKSAGDGMSKNPAPFVHQEPLPPLPTILTPLPLGPPPNPSNHALSELRHTIENFQLSNGSLQPSASNPRRRSQTTPYQTPYPKARIEYDGDLRFDSDASQASEASEVVLQNRLASSVTSLTTDLNLNYIGKTSQQDKAKQIMGLSGQKSLPSTRRKPMKDDGNITALETEFSDVRIPEKPIFDESPKDNTVTANGVSVEEDPVKGTARDIYNGAGLSVAPGDAARWLMNSSDFNTKVRTAYMDLFDFMGLDILTAVRRVCARLLLKGESQQLDRLLESLAMRWYECNPGNGMKDPDVVHAIAYSIFLLNTDLHIVDISSSQRMTRQQFVRNTMHTIISTLPSSKRVSTEPIRSLSSGPKGKFTTFPSASSPNLSHLTAPIVSRSGSLLKVGQAVQMARNPSTQSLDHGTGRLSRESTRTVAIAERLSWSLFDEKIGPYGGMASFGSQSAWEAQMDCALKEIYNSVKQAPLEQAQPPPSNDSNPSMNLKPNGLGVSRSASVMSQASHFSDSGGTKSYNAPKASGRDWLGRSRSQPRLPLHPQDSHVSIRSDRSSMEESSKSPPNSSQKKHHRSASHGRTPSSRSIDSFNHDNGPSIGFANSLNQTIIREESRLSPTSFIDEELQEHRLILSGPPWAKEGVLKSKRHLEANHKKSREKGWIESFVVIDKGQMRLFQFDSPPVKNTSQVGGGNWQQNASMIASFLLRQTLASALPSPGYSKQRPHVWLLTLPSGTVFFFEAGTAELVKEWVESANYWAARTSKEPLKAGVSNMEWGWGDCLAMSEDDVTDDGTSLADSRRSTFEAQRSPTTNGKATYGGESRVLKGDKATIREWKPPQASLMASSLKEREQLQAIESFVKQLEEDFGQHNDIRPLMLRSFSPRHPNSTRALSNWERKCQYLLREIVRYKTYVEVLSRALILRENLIEKSLASKKTSTTTTTPTTTGEMELTPEPWFDLNRSASNSVSTEHTKLSGGEKDEPVASG